ncbi:MAG: nucleotidyltransferase domain-containing protein [Bacilli bacterium]|nr:nucleotidyltransferase domain-containing protein [Bacilli bacterium]
MQCGITQPAAAKLVGIPFGAYCRYEADEAYKGSFKYAQIVKILDNYLRDKVLPLDEIRAAVSSLCSNYPVNACYLFGSYAKGKDTKDSDVDLMLASAVEGIEHCELLGLLEEKLGKRVDLIRLETAIQNVKLMNEILKDGVKVYG